MNEPPPPQQEQYIANNNNNSEYVTADQEMADSYYYINADGYKVGPFTMDDIAQQYKDNEISDDTQIWSGDQTQNDAKPLNEIEKIYSKLPKPPKRKEPYTSAATTQNGNEEHKPLHIESNNINNGGKTNTNTMNDPVVVSSTTNKSGGCCCI
eukprot:UN05050